MAYNLVARGDVSSITSLGDYQGSFEEGDRGYLDLHLSASSSDILGFAVNELNAHLLNRIEGYKLESLPSLLRLHFKVAILPLVIIAAAVAAVIVLWGLIIAWKLYKMSPIGAITSVAVMILIFALAATAAVAVIITARRYLT